MLIFTTFLCAGLTQNPPLKLKEIHLFVFLFLGMYNFGSYVKPHTMGSRINKAHLSKIPAFTISGSGKFPIQKHLSYNLTIWHFKAIRKKKKIKVEKIGKFRNILVFKFDTWIVILNIYFFNSWFLSWISTYIKLFQITRDSLQCNWPQSQSFLCHGLT